MIENETKSVLYWVEVFYNGGWCSLGSRFELASSAIEVRKMLQAGHPDREYRIIKRTTTYIDEVVE